MVHRLAAVTLTLAILGQLVAADSVQEHWYPGSGVAQLYSWNDDFEPKVVSQGPFVTGSDAVFLEPLSLVSESAVETRVQVLVAGLGAGAGKGGGQAAVADANAVADIKAASIRGAVAVGVKSEQVPLQVHHWWSGFVRFSVSFAFVVKALCMVLNVFYQASPLPLIQEFNSKGDTGEADLAPFIALAYGGWQWCFYGTFAYLVTNKSGFLVLVYSNVVGATFGLFYVYSFMLNCRNVSMLKRSTFYYYVLATIVVSQFGAIVFLQPVQALFFSGLISSAWSSIASLSLISTVPTVYEQRNSKSLPGPLLFMGWISALLWVVCGVMLWDPWITFPNVIAIVVCTFALYLCWKFPADGSADGLLKSPPMSVKEAAFEEPTCGSAVTASPLQRSLGYFARSRSSASIEKEALCEPMPTMRRASYGGTGGTGDGF